MTGFLRSWQHSSMSDIDGLYSEDPHRNPDARFIGLVEEITPELIGMGGGSGSDVGTGGMAAKLAAARIATDSGSDMIICNADNVDVIHELINVIPGTSKPGF